MTPANDLAAFLRGFHSLALAAYVGVAIETGQNPSDRDLDRRRAYDLYATELRQRPFKEETA